MIEYENFVDFIERKKQFSLKTFGPGQRVSGIIDHIKKELIEIQENPNDLMEYIDVMLLAMDGAWRAGFSANEIAQALYKKQEILESRTWPDYRTIDQNKAITHIKEKTLVDIVIDFDEHNYVIKHNGNYVSQPSWQDAENYCKNNNLEPRII